MIEKKACRFFVRKEDLRGNTAVLTEEESHHLKNVRRLKKSDRVILFDGAGNEFSGKISKLGERVEVVLEKKGTRLLPGGISISLAQSLPKKKKMEFVIEKACELGLREIIPLESERSTLRIAQGARARVLSRWQRILIQTCKQCQLDWTPDLRPFTRFRDLTQRFKDFDFVLLPHPDKDAEPVSEVTAELKRRVENSPTGKKVLILIGPEGGFSDREIQQAREKGAKLVCLGDLVLKTETAAIVDIALIKYGANV
jgi:16S rRNA (uracil1498-N3)-methyltransferase